VLAVGYLLPFFYLLWSLRKGRIAGPNPWRATGLEWQTTSPPSTFNFDATPVVRIGPYAYNPTADELEDARLELESLRRRWETMQQETEGAHVNGNAEGSEKTIGN
jgi:cytochrome c oxidase subunit 1